MTSRDTCDHQFGSTVAHCTVMVRVTGKWFSKCSRCRSRRRYSTMVRCVRCGVLVHETCATINSRRHPQTEQDAVDAATTTTTEAVDDAATAGTEPPAAVHTQCAAVPEMEPCAAPSSAAVLREGGDLAGDSSSADEQQLSEHDAFERLMSSSNPHMRVLKEVDLDIMFSPDKNLSDTIYFLDEIAAEEGLTLFYEPHVPDVLVGDNVYLQLSISPIDTITIGFGKTMVEAHSETAYNCLLFFKHNMI